MSEIISADRVSSLDHTAFHQIMRWPSCRELVIKILTIQFIDDHTFATVAIANQVARLSSSRIIWRKVYTRNYVSSPFLLSFDGFLNTNLRFEEIMIIKIYNLI